MPWKMLTLFNQIFLNNLPLVEELRDLSKLSKLEVWVLFVVKLLGHLWTTCFGIVPGIMITMNREMLCEVIRTWHIANTGH